MTGLTGKVALVTGGSRGIGAAVASRLAADGASVAITYRNSAERAKDVVAGIESAGRQGLAIAADNEKADEVRAAVDRTAEEFGRLDILVNNAGIFAFRHVEDVTVDELDRMIAVHVKAPFIAAQAAVRHLPRGGRIVTVGSSFAERTPGAGVSVYSLTKTALIGLTKGLARDLGDRGISVSLVQPGSTDTEMNPEDSDVAEEEKKLIALGRYAKPHEIAAAVSYLVSEDGAYVTGTAFTVDGGMSA